MTIKEVSQKYSINQDTLRYYEKVGLIRPVARKNGKLFFNHQDPKMVEWFDNIVSVRRNTQDTTKE